MASTRTRSKPNLGIYCRVASVLSLVAAATTAATSAAGASVTDAGASNAPGSDASVAAVKASVLGRSSTGVRIRAAGSEKSYGTCDWDG